MNLQKRIEEYRKIKPYRESSQDIFDRAAKWFIELIGNLDENDVRYAQIEDFQGWLSKGRSPASVKTYLAIMKSFFSWLTRRRYIEYNPFDGIVYAVVPKKKYEMYQPDEIKRIFQIADLRWKIIFSLGLCMMRKSEILNLCVKDIDFESNLIKITGKHDTATTWKWEIKDSDERFIGISPCIATLLAERLEHKEMREMPYIVLKKKYWIRNMGLRAKGALTWSYRNDPWGNFTADVRRILKRANVPYRRFHDTRGTSATERLLEGYSINDIQTLLGHSSIQTTAKYLHNVDERSLVKRSGETFAKFYETYLVP